MYSEWNSRLRMSGPECCSNPPTLNPTAGAGHVEILGGLHSYLAGSPHSKPAVLLISDIFGIYIQKFHLYHLLFLLSVFDFLGVHFGAQHNPLLLYRIYYFRPFSDLQNLFWSKYLIIFWFFFRGVSFWFVTLSSYTSGSLYIFVLLLLLFVFAYFCSLLEYTLLMILLISILNRLWFIYWIDYIDCMHLINIIF